MTPKIKSRKIKDDKKEVFYHHKNWNCPKSGKKPEKLYLVLDCETATLPIIKNFDMSPAIQKKISIAKPLIYDLGWQVISSTGRVYSRHNFLVQETFFVPAVFNTAYYKDKRPLYIDLLNDGLISTGNWQEIMQVFRQDLERTDICLAYNAMFDFKKAIPFTERYINALYSNYYNEWEERQYKSIERMIDENGKSPKNPEFDGINFNFRGKDYPMADLWALSCNLLINKDKYKKDCIRNGYITDSGLYFKTSAEQTTRFILKDNSFNEAHTALEDVLIETDILKKVLKKTKNQIDVGLDYFPFQALGETVDYCLTLNNKGKPIFTKEELENILEILYKKSLDYTIFSSFATKLESKASQLDNFIRLHYSNQKTDKKYHYWLALGTIERDIYRLKKEKNKLKIDGKVYNAKIKMINNKKQEREELLKEIKKNGYEIYNNHIYKAGTELDYLKEIESEE